MSVAAECLFLDVGQGTANVILLGEGRAIVIDCGPKGAKAVLDGVWARKVRTIEALVLSHNDGDHIGGASSVLARFPKNINRIFRVQDRALENDRLVRLLVAEKKLGNLNCEPRTFAIDVEPRVLFTDPKTGVELICMSPTYWETQESQLEEDANAASAIIVLKCGSRQLIFSGDSSIAQWRAVNTRLGKRLDCDVLSVSHHAGITWKQGDDPVAELDWLHRDALRCQHAVISVGTTNTYGHPRADVINAIRKNGGDVLCTQITSACCGPVNDVMGGVRVPSPPSRSLVKEKIQRQFACAGTVVATISKDVVRIEKINSHREGVDRLIRCGKAPLCRR